MNALNKLTLSTTGFTVSLLLFMGVYNSIQVNSYGFMQQPTDIRFIKRLDEIKGKVTIGRMAASTVQWESLSQVSQQHNTDKKIKDTPELKEEIKSPEPSGVVEVEQSVVNIPDPAVKADLDMQLSKVFFKKPLQAGTFSGAAKTVDGVIEEVYVELPGGHSFEINTRDRMVGNVFQYEDTQTRELKSGMFYEVKKGTYMITLTNDSQYAGLRMEFVAENNAEVAYGNEYNQDISWGMNTQNPEQVDSQLNELPNVDNNIDNTVDNNEYSELDYGHTDLKENTSYSYEFQS